MIRVRNAFITEALEPGSTTSTAISPDASYMAAGSAESVIRLWSLKKEALYERPYGYATKRAQSQTGKLGPLQSHSSSILIRFPSCRGNSSCQSRQTSPQTRWSLWPSLLSRLRSHRRLSFPSLPSPLLVTRRLRTTLVHGHLPQPSRIQGTCGPGLGGRVGTVWGVLCDG